MQEDDELIPLAVAAAQLGLSYGTAYRQVRLERLHATFIGGKLMVRASEIERYQRDVLRRDTPSMKDGSKGE